MSYLSPWYRKCGVELTFVPNVRELKSVKDAEKFQHFLYQHTELAVTEVKQQLKKDRVKVWDDRIVNDDGALEIATIPHRSWGSFQRHYDKITACAYHIGFRPQVDFIGTGGGHVNIDCPDAQLAMVVLYDQATRPYLPWCFNDPEDKTEARSNLSELKHYGCSGASGSGFCTWRNMERLEFRGFIAARNWCEQEKHIAFAQKYVEWCANRLKKGQITSLNGVTLGAFQRKSFNELKDDFLKLVDTLKLPVEIYEIFPDTYLKERYRLGRSYLT